MDFIKNYYKGITVILAVAIAIYFYFGIGKKSTEETSQSQTNAPTASESVEDTQTTSQATTTTQPATSTQPKTTISTTSSATTAVATNLSYGDAIAQYEGRRIQFSNDCQAVPSNMTVKKGTKIMFDNRADKTRKIVVDGKTFSIANYGFKIISVSSTKPIPYTVLINCDTSINVAQIILQ